jgi:hypothetical protein
MASSNNVHAGAGNDVTHSANGSAKPSGTETIFVDVPGETVYVDVPGETVYVDVPGPTVEVPVYVDVPGPTVYVDTSILAEFDLSNVPDVDLKTNGDYVIPVTGGSTSATTAILKVFKAENVGATGVQRIKDGKLELMPATVTSELGLQYWSSLPASMLGIDIRTLSSTLSADVGNQTHEYVVEFEVEQLLKDGLVQQYNPSFTYLRAGILTNLDVWDVAPTPLPQSLRPTGMMASHRHTANPPYSPNANLGLEITGFAFLKGSFGSSGYTTGNMATFPAPMDSFRYNSSTKYTVYSNGQAVSAIHSNDTASLKASNFVTYSSYNSSGTADVATTNSVWIAMMASRSTGSILSGTVPWRIKKIILRERRSS